MVICKSVDFKSMNSLLLHIFLILCSLLSHGLCQITCGRLKAVYEYKQHTVDCKIRLYPSEDLQIPIRESHFYRWILTRNSTAPKIILQKNVGTYDTSKYDEVNFTLLIRNLSKSDEGRYRVNCWTERHEHYFSEEVTVSIPEQSQDNTDTKQPESFPAEGGIGNTALIVLSICSVIIVAIVAGTVCLILLKRHGGIRGVKRLVSDEGTSANALVRNDHMPETENIIHESRQEEETKGDEYAEIIVECHLPRTEKSDFMEDNTNYDVVANVKTESDSNIRPKDKFESNGKSDSISPPNDINESNNTEAAPEYAKVVKRRSLPATPGSKADYKITFPEINCSRITQSLGDSFHEQEVVNRREPVTYANLVSRPQRDKSRRSRASRRELQYAILALSEPEKDPLDVSTKGESESSKLQPCQYATIDFERKAFVAPIRKAPSSWYRRRNKKGKKKKY